MLFYFTINHFSHNLSSSYLQYKGNGTLGQHFHKMSEDFGECVSTDTSRQRVVIMKDNDNVCSHHITNPPLEKRWIFTSCQVSKLHSSQSLWHSTIFNSLAEMSNQIYSSFFFNNFVWNKHILTLDSTKSVRCVNKNRAYNTLYYCMHRQIEFISLKGKVHRN